jgi:hypothetical protein
MPNVWIWNIASDQQQFFADELKAGRLRQGWGYDDRLDLRLIVKKNQQKQSLDEEESAAWNRLNVMIMDWGIKVGDIILVKNTPTWGWYTLAEVAGGYQYDRNTPSEDFGHFIGVKLRREINKHTAHVAGDLRSSVDNSRWPIASAVKRAGEILSLLKAADVDKPVRWPERIASQLPSVIDLIREQVVRRLGPSEFEELVQDLLNIEKFENIKLTAGAGENGADIVMSVSAPFFDDLNIVVQIKHHPGEDNDPRSVDQLRRAFDYYKAVAGLLVTSADKIGAQLQDAVEKLKTEGKTVAVLHGEELFRRVLHILASETGDRAN